MTIYKEISNVSFPKPSDININMMPFVFGDNETLPDMAKPYLPIINQCSLQKNEIAYLTIREGFVLKGKSQSRPGVHTEATSLGGWGGGGKWGGGNLDNNNKPVEGVYMASTDGLCRVWNEESFLGDSMGAIKEDQLKSKSEIMKPGVLYWLTDRVPHQALLSDKDCYRQFVRVVSKNIFGWYEQHSTRNPLGIVPPSSVKIIPFSKFV